MARAFLFDQGKMTDLGGLAPGFSSDTNWISPNGLVTGEARTGQAADPSIGGWTMHGILWAHGQMIDLGTLDGGPISLTTGVNDSGEVAGFALNAIPDPYSMFGGNQTRAYLWKNGVMKDLGTLGGPDAKALRINQRGQIAGNSYLSVNPSDSCGIETGGFLWYKGTMTDLGSLGGTCTFVNDMNENGQIVGGSFLAGDQVLRPFLWQNGKLNDLGTRGGDQGLALAVNAQGDVVGFQSVPEGPGDNSFDHAVLWSGGKIFDLGTLGPGQCSLAWSANSRLQAVGVNSNDCSFERPGIQAVISEHGGPLIDLNTLIPPNSGVQLANATNINDRGEIVVYGVFADGNISPVLLVPCGPDLDSCQNIGAPAPTKPRTETGARISAKAWPWMHNQVSLSKQFFGGVPWIGKKP